MFYTPLHPEATRHKRTLTSTDDAYHRAISNFIFNIYKYSPRIWSALKMLCLCSPNSADNLRDVTGNNADCTTTGTPSFVADEGYGGFTTSDYINTGLIPHDSLTPNYCYAAFYTRVWPSGGAADKTVMGAAGPATNRVLYARAFEDYLVAGKTAVIPVIQKTATSSSEAENTFIGAVAAGKSDQNFTHVGEYNNTKTRNRQNASTRVIDSLPTYEMFVGALNSSGTPLSAYSDSGEISCWAAGDLVDLDGYPRDTSYAVAESLHLYMTERGKGV